MKDYTFNAPAFEITKSYRGDSGEMLVEGIASTTNVDVTGERMSAEAIAKMAARLIGKPLRSEHGKGWDDKLGEIVKADIVSDNFGKPSLWIQARLYDWSSKAKDLFALLKNGAQMGLSVAGKINPGGIVRQYVEKLGKYVMTYIDINPAEVSVTDHPANLDAFDLAVAKSLNLEKVEEKLEDEDYMQLFKTEKSDETVPNELFLDVKNKKYPVDKRHLLPALRYFNHDKQREEGGYNAEQWADMGKKLVMQLNKEYTEEYQYDTDSNKVIKLENSKGKEVTNMNKSTLKVNKDVADFIKQFNPQAEIDGEVKKVEKKEVQPEDEVTKAKKAVEPSTDTTTSTSPSAKKDDKGDELSTLLSSLEDTLSQMSGGKGSDDSDASDESDEEKAKKAKKAEDDSVAACMKKAQESLDALKAMQKAKKAQTTSSTPSTETTDTTMAKTLKEVVDALKEVKKNQDALNEKIDSLPKERKSVAHVVEKNMNDGKDEEVKKAQASFEANVEKMKADKAVSATQLYKYRTYGIFPPGYEKKS